MDLTSAGSSPVFPIIYYNSYSFLINHLNLLCSTKRRWSLIKYNKKTLNLLKIFKKLGFVSSFLIISSSKKLLKISPFFYRKHIFFSSVKLISTPSKVFTVKSKTLTILNRSLGGTIIILETSRGLITHKEAIKLKIGGRLLCVLN